MGTATGTESGQAIHEAIGSFSATPSTSLHPVMLSGQQQQLTEAQLEQIKEQIAVSGVCVCARERERERERECVCKCVSECV